MKKGCNNSDDASALRVTLAVALPFVLAVLFAFPFSAAPFRTPAPATPRVAIESAGAGIVLVSRYSDAQAFASAAGVSTPPPRVQTDFLPADLQVNAAAPAAKGGSGALVNTISQSSISLDGSGRAMQVGGFGRIQSQTFVPSGFAQGSSKLIVLTFTLTDSTFAYSLTGDLSGGDSSCCHAASTAKLTMGSSTIFQVNAPPPVASLGESGTLLPGTYTLTVESNASAHDVGGPTSIINYVHFTFSLSDVGLPTPTITPTPTVVPTAIPSSTVALPNESLNNQVPIDTVLLKPVTTTNIDPSLRYVGFQADFTFNESIITFSSPFVEPAGLTTSGWNVSGNILPGAGPTRIFRVSAFSLDFTPLSGSGVLYNLRMLRVGVAGSTPLNWQSDPDHFVYIDADLEVHVPTQLNGSITITGGTPTPCPQCTPTPTPVAPPPCAMFSNSSPITIPASGNGGIAAPYPSTITVSGLGGEITKVTVSINGLTHTAPADIDVLLVGPTGQNAIIMSDVGGYFAVIGLNLVLDDAAGNFLPKCNRFFCPGGTFISGTYRPTNNQECDDGTQAVDTFPAPAPSPRGGTPLSLFNGTNPNGIWSLYVLDDEGSLHTGSFTNGWTITLSTSDCVGPTPMPQATPTLTPGPTHFRITAPTFLPIPYPITFTVTARDASDQIVDYFGTLHFTSSNPNAQLPPDTGLTNGMGTFTASFGDTFIGHTVTATDTINFHLTGTSNCVTLGDMTPTPTPTSSPTPATPTPTPAITPTPAPDTVYFIFQNFDHAIPPALPWATSFTNGAANCTPTGTCALGTNWVTTTVNPIEGPISAFHNAPGCVTDSVMETNSFFVYTNLDFPIGVNFLQNFDLQPGRDGGVLEISYDGGCFVDIVQAGGSANYNGTISTGFLSPIAGRNAWTGAVTGGVGSASLPFSARGRNVKLRFRLATDCSGSGNGWWIDRVVSTGHISGGGTPAPTLTPSPTPSPGPTATPFCNLSEAFDNTATLFTLGWNKQNNSSSIGPNDWSNGSSARFPAQTGSPTSYVAVGSLTGCGTISNWLLTPTLTLANGGVFTFWTRTVASPIRPDRLQVRMSTNGGSSNVGGSATSVGDFSTLLLDINPTYTTSDYPNVWTQYTITLSNIPSPLTGRLAFRYFVENGGPNGPNSDYIGIDTAQYLCSTPTPTPPTPTPASPTPTPTPTPTPGPVTLVDRLSDARASASVMFLPPDTPPPQVQTDFLPASLSNSAGVSGEPGFAHGQSTSNSAIMVDNTKGMLLVTGDGTAMSNALGSGFDTHASAGAKLMALNFGISHGASSYSLSGQLSAGGFGNQTATAKLADEKGTVIFEVSAGGAGPPSVTLSETGLLPAGSYTFSVALETDVFGSPFGNNSQASGNFDFALTASTVTTPTPTPTPTPSASVSPTPMATAHALNLSTRLQVGTGSDVGIGGFIITGSSPRLVLLRGIGPSLVGVGQPLADPMLELHGPGGFVTVTNNNWRDNQEEQIIATGIPPTNDLESAILVTLDPGAYTAILSGNNNGTGVGLVEIYDLSQGTGSKMANISTRALVYTGSDIVIAGFILGGGTDDDRIVIRGIGPSLSGAGIPNVLADPYLELRDGNGSLIASNDNWCPEGGPPCCPVEPCFPPGIAPTNELESVILRTLSPGAYTALLFGVNNGVGVGLVEVYDLGAP